MLRVISRVLGRAPRGEQPRAELAMLPTPHEGNIYDFGLWWGEQSRLLPERYPFDRFACVRLIEAYAEFCNAYGLLPMSDVALLRRIKAAGFEAYREGAGKRQRFYRVSLRYKQTATLLSRRSTADEGGR